MILSSSNILRKLALLFLMVAALYYARSFLIPLSLGGILATLLMPVSRRLESKGLPKGIAVSLCLLIILLLIGLVFWLISWQISEIVQDVSLIKTKFNESTLIIQQYIFEHSGISADSQWKILKNGEGFIAGFLQNFAGSLISLAGNLLFILVYFFLFLYYRGHLKKFILKLFPETEQSKMSHIIQRCANVSQQYLVGLAKMIFCLWIMYGIGFSLLGVENALFFAVLCGLLEIVPFIGNLTGTLLTVLVAAVNGGSLAMLGGIVVVYAIIQLIQGWILEPLILGPQVRINPFFTIVALVIGELIWGIPGIILAIPLTAIAKIIFDHLESLKAFGFLIGELEINPAERRVMNWWRKRENKGKTKE